MVPLTGAAHIGVHDDLRKYLVKPCPRALSAAFKAWLLREPGKETEFASIANRAAAKEGAQQDFQTVASLGFAAHAGILSATQTEVLRTGVIRQTGRDAVFDGVPMPFCFDAVGILGIALGTKVLADVNITNEVVRWMTRFLGSSYEMDRAEDWQRCLFAVADIHLGKPLDLAIPKSAATADVRTALLARGLIDVGDGNQAREDAVQTLALAAQEPTKDFAYDRAVLRLAAIEWVMRTRPPADKGVPLTRMDGSIEWIDSQADQAGRPFEPSATEGQTESAQRTEEARRTGVFGTAGNSKARPTGGGFAANPQIRKLVEKDPEARPLVNLVAQVEQARAQGEVTFRESELKGRWAEWSGVFPWEGARDPDTTDCPWWVAGAEYVFLLTAAWRRYSPGEPEKIETYLSQQIELAAEYVYHSKVHLHDIMRGKSSKADHILVGHPKRFFNIAFLFSMQKFAEIDLDEWRDHAAKLAGALTDLKSMSANQSASDPAPGVSESPVTAASDTPPGLAPDTSGSTGSARSASDLAPLPSGKTPSQLVVPDQEKKMRRMGGRPPKDQTGAIHAKWTELGKPKVTAHICDKIAAGFFADELKGVAPGTTKHKSVRERVRQAIQRSQRAAAT